MKSKNPIVANAIKACNEFIPKGWKRAANPGAFKKGDTVLLDRKIYKIVDDFEYSDEVPVQPLHGGKTEIRDLLHAVGIVKNSTVATNKGIDNPAELRAAADLARALADAKTKVGAALGKFNSTKFADIKWAQSVNKKCDAVASAINEARTAIQKGADV